MCLQDWTIRYQLDALFVRVGTPTRFIKRRLSGKKETIFDDHVFPHKVTFVAANRDNLDSKSISSMFEVSGCSVDWDSTEQQFKLAVKGCLGEEFNCELTKDWTELRKLLEEGKYQRSLGKNSTWKSLGVPQLTGLQLDINSSSGLLIRPMSSQSYCHTEASICPHPCRPSTFHMKCFFLLIS